MWSASAPTRRLARLSRGASLRARSTASDCRPPVRIGTATNCMQADVLQKNTRSPFAGDEGRGRGSFGTRIDGTVRGDLRVAGRVLDRERLASGGLS
jgi:hypothetical protein